MLIMPTSQEEDTITTQSSQDLSLMSVQPDVLKVPDNLVHEALSASTELKQVTVILFSCYGRFLGKGLIKLKFASYMRRVQHCYYCGRLKLLERIFMFTCMFRIQITILNKEYHTKINYPL